MSSKKRKTTTATLGYSALGNKANNYAIEVYVHVLLNVLYFWNIFINNP